MFSVDISKASFFVLLMKLALSTADSPDELPVLETLYEFEAYSQQNMAPDAFGYLKAFATYGDTVENNEAAFQKIRLRPKRMIPLGNFNTSLSILGSKVSMPIGFSPVALQLIFHTEGEKVIARAAELSNTIHILSLWASTSVEELAAAAPSAIRWQQVQPIIPREDVIGLIRRAEAAQFKAIVLTIDEPAPRITHGFAGINLTGVNMSTWLPNIQLPFTRDASWSWTEVAWLVEQTHLPVVVKGLLDASQVKDAKAAGVKAIIVSNHGGRVLDGAPATIEVLAEIVDAVEQEGGDLEVYLDSGIRKGLDVFRALAIGAKMVFIGRPQLWGSFYNGTEGTLKVLDILYKEFVNTAMLSGIPGLESINRETIVNPFQPHQPAETPQCPTSGGVHLVINWHISMTLVCWRIILRSIFY